MQHCVERSWPQVGTRSSQLTWPSVKASQLSRRRLNMHTQATCVTEQAWIPHKLCLVGWRQTLSKVQRSHKEGQKMYMGLGFLLRLVVSMSRQDVHTQATCVTEQTWILHKLCLVGWRQTSYKVQQSHKDGQKIYMGLGFPLKLVVSILR